MHTTHRRTPDPLLFAGLTALIFCLIVFGLITRAGYITAIDQTGFKWALAVRAPALSKFVILITSIGNPLVTTLLSCAVGLIFALRRQWNLLAFVAVNMGGINGINFIVKAIVHRVRPFNADLTIHNLVSANGWSFPSGHSAGAVLLYGTLLICASALVQEKWGRVALRVVSVFLLIAIPLSRIYVQVHYPTDVIAGMCLGATGLLLSLHFFKTDEI